MRGFGRGGREPTMLYSWRLQFNVSLLICVIVPVEQVVIVSLFAQGMLRDLLSGCQP